MNRTSALRRISTMLAVFVMLTQTDDASAVGTRTFTLDTLDAMKGGELEGTSVDSLGRVRAGFVLGNMPIGDASAVWCSLVMPDGAVLLGTGNDGKIYRAHGGQVAEYATTGQMAVTSLALDGQGKVVAGTIPSGKVFSVAGQGAAKELYSLPGTEHVWALATDPKTKAVLKKLKPLQDVGLGYVKLGQSSATLSGGESQRVKLALFLSQEKAEPSIFIFDEPTTGLHFHDIKTLMKAFDALILKGHTVIVIEHNMDVIKCADHIIDLGPEGGKSGGYVVFEGTPEEIIKCEKSYTGQFLKEKLNQ